MEIREIVIPVLGGTVDGLSDFAFAQLDKGFEEKPVYLKPSFIAHGVTALVEGVIASFMGGNVQAILASLSGRHIGKIGTDLLTLQGSRSLATMRRTAVTPGGKIAIERVTGLPKTKGTIEIKKEVSLPQKFEKY
ncbi:MAG: hypothetical protein QME47_07545 [Candidatus Thermoplasmatota archaeon]|nr:hypothetical protein [Candidatus Thermoplasmatota archaeon]